ncbi:MAG: YcxB family protein [Bacillota bacterium]|nr:YcxB family protein [Bacillota bacterium]
MQYHFELTEQDYITFNMHYILHSPQQQSQLRRSRIWISLLPILVAVTTVWATGTQDWIYAALLCLIGVACFFLFPRLFYAIVRKNLRHLLREKRNTVLGPRTLIFEEEELRHVTEHGEERTRYSAIVDLRTTAEAIYLYHGPMVADILPLRAVGDPAERDRLLAFLRTKLPFLTK